ncbi:MAG: hypothetical protein ACTSUE_13600 [Promethearchaeota archaeon]
MTNSNNGYSTEDNSTWENTSVNEVETKKVSMPADHHVIQMPHVGGSRVKYKEMKILYFTLTGETVDYILVIDRTRITLAVGLLIRDFDFDIWEEYYVEKRRDGQRTFHDTYKYCDLENKFVLSSSMQRV